MSKTDKIVMKYSSPLASNLHVKVKHEDEILTVDQFFRVVEDFYKAIGFLNDIDIIINPEDPGCVSSGIIHIRPNE